MTWRIVIPLFVAVFAVGTAARSMPGAPIDADINDNGTRNALKFAVAQHNRELNDMYISEVMDVIKVQKQVVAGMNYFITAKLGKTNCRKNSTNQVCTVHEDLQLARPYQCKFTVYSRPWTSTIKLTKQDCTSASDPQ